MAFAAKICCYSSGVAAGIAIASGNVRDAEAIGDAEKASVCEEMASADEGKENDGEEMANDGEEMENVDGVKAIVGGVKAIVGGNVGVAVFSIEIADGETVNESGICVVMGNAGAEG